MRRVFLIISLLCLMPFTMMAQTKSSSYDEKLEQLFGRSPAGMELPREAFNGGGDRALEMNYGYGLVNGSFVQFNPAASFTAPSSAGMQFDGYDFVSAEVVAYNSTTDHIYAYTSDGRFCLIDPQSNELTELNTGVTPMTELAYDTYTKAMYGLRYGVLYSVNMADGTSVPVNGMSTGGNNWVALAINNDGEMYAILNTFSSGASDLYYINTTTWNSTRIGRVPYRTEYAQSMAFNRDNGNLYWWQASEAGFNFLRVNPTNAVCTAIWPNNGFQVYGMFFKYSPKTYNITYETVENGTFSGPALAAENDEVTITVTPDYGYRLGSLTWNGNEIDIEEGEPYVFTMPGEDVLVSGSFLLSLHNITVIDPLDGTLATDPENEGWYNTNIQVLPTPDPGFGVQSITYIANGYATTITQEPWQFTMPDYDVTVQAVYEQTGENLIYINTDYYGYFDDIVTVAVEMTNDNLVAGTEMIIDLGENLTFMPGSLALSDRAEAESWTITGNVQPGNKLKVTTFNLEKAYYAGNQGPIFTFQVQCARVVSVNELAISGLVVGTPDATGLEVGTSNGQLEILDVEMNQPDNQVVCNQAMTAPVVFGSEIAESEGVITYHWTNDTPAIGLEAEGEGDIAAFTAINEGNEAVVANLTVTPTLMHNGNPCVGSTLQFTITVNPTGFVNPVDNIEVHNGDLIDEIVFTTPLEDGEVTYAWTNDNTEIGLEASGEGNIPAFTAINEQVSVTSVANITVTPTYTNEDVSCVGEPINFTITVLPTHHYITVLDPKDGELATDPTEVGTWQETVTVLPTPDPGFGMGTITVAYNGEEEVITAEPWEFVMPDYDVTVSAHYVQTGVNTLSIATDYYGYFDDIVTVAVDMTNENYVTGTEMKIALGENLTFIPGSLTLTDRAAGENWNITSMVQDGNILKVTTFNTDLAKYEGNEGAIFTFQVQCARVESVNALAISGVYASTPDGTNLIIGSEDGELTILDVVMDQPEDQVVCNNTMTEAIEFSTTIAESEGPITYAWTNDNTEIGLEAEGEGNIDAFTAINAGNAAVVANLTVTPTLIHNGNPCVGSTKEFTITVNPTPVMVQVEPIVVCNGDEIAEIVFADNTTDGTVTYAWTNTDATIGLVAEGEGNIATFAAVNEGTTSVVATITVVPTYTNAENGGSCEGEPMSFTITVNPTPVMEAIADQVVCNRDNTVEVIFASNVTDGTMNYLWTCDNAVIGCEPAGQDEFPSFLAINDGNEAVTATFTVTPYYTNMGVTCIGTPVEFTITVNPTPVMEAIADQVVCNGENTAEVIFASNVTDGTMNYLWTCDNAVIGCEAAGQDEFPSFVAINEGNVAVTANFTVTPYYTNMGITCTGAPVEFTITVNPTPIMEAIADQVVCNGENTVEVIFASNVTDGTMNYLWTCDNAEIGCEAAGQDEFPSFLAINEGNEAVTATFTVTPYYTNLGITCAGTPVEFTITVNPAVVMDAVENMIVCDNTEVVIPFTTLITDGEVTYTWTNDNPAIGLEETGEGSISFISANVNGEPIVANITVTPSYENNGITCVGEPMSFTITVYPTPVMEEVANQTIYSREYTEDILFNSNITDDKVIFNWVNDNPAIGLAAEGTGNILSFMGAAPITTTQVANITVTPVYSDGMICEGNGITFTITVEPTYLVVIADGIENGTLTDNARVAANGEHYAPAGEEITLTATPAEGYLLENVTAHMLTNNLVNVPVVDDQFFTMPEFDVECVATFIDDDNLLIKPGVIDLGYRPINAWMYSKFFDVANISDEDFDITSMDLTDYTFFDLDDVTLPFTIAAGAEAQFGINTNYKNVAPGLKNTTLALIASHNRKPYTRDVVATAYTPVTPDVWELAANVTSYPYVTTQPTKGVIYDNYQLPGETPDGFDGVYKLVFDHDVVINAEITSGNDPKVVVYDNGFRQVGGPHLDNYHNAPLDMENHATIGDGALTLGQAPYYTYYKYSLSQVLYKADELAAAGLMGGKITSIEYFTNSTNCYTRDNISIWMANVTENTVAATSVVTTGMPLVYTGSYTQVVGWNEFVFNGDSFVWDGTSNILVTFVMNHGAYNSSTPWVGTNPGFAATSFAYNDNNAYYPTDQTYTMNVNSTFRPNTKFNGLDIQSEGEIVDGSPIVDLGLFAGTYYLVASSTSEDSYTLEINAEDIPLPLAPTAIYPAHEAQGIETPVTFQFELGEYTHEYQLLLGTQYNNQEVVLDWTSDLTGSFNAGELLHNTIYFWRINERNSTGITEGPLWVFTTELNVPENLTVEDDELYEGEDAILHWNIVSDRALIGYNVYQDGVKINSTPVLENTYTVTGLAYNLDGYDFTVTAAYNEGESNPSNVVTVYVSGYGFVSGHVYEQDGVTGIAGATVTLIGFDEFDELVGFEFTTDNDGAYSGEVYAGYYFGLAEKEGYQTVGDNTGIAVDYDDEVTDYDFIMFENYYPVTRVVAEEIDANNVHVFWGWEMIEDFESGDFSAYEWNNNGTYPWAITTNNPYEGTYCMKSTNEGVNSSTSSIEITMSNEKDGMMSFFHKISSEASYDKGYFYVDGAVKATLSGAGSWTEKQVAITAGTHTFKWSYEKDSSLSNNDDCFYVDYINFFFEPEPLPEGTTFFDFETGMQGWNAIDADGDGHTWGLISELYSGTAGHDESGDGVASQSYAGGALTPDNYLISPQLTLGGNMSFWAAPYSAYFAGEHFAVLVSTTGTNISDFTMVGEWTLDGDKNVVPHSEPRDGEPKVGTWVQYNVDLSAYEGQTGYVAIRHFNCTDEWALLIDDITIQPNTRAFSNFNVYRKNELGDGAVSQLATGVTEYEYMDNTWGSAATGIYRWGVSANYAGNRGESEIVWSNAIDKTMTANVTVNVTTNSNDLVTGAVVTLTNTSEPELGLVYNTTLDETGTYTWEGLRKGEYDVTIVLDGFAPLAATESIWGNTTLNYELTELINNIEDLYVSTTGWAMFGNMPSGTAGATEPWTLDFENGLPEGWTVTDANNDGWTWTMTSDIPTTWSYYASLSLDWYHNGSNAICSGSYINGVGALNPDEYLITDQVTPGAGYTFSFWAAATDANYPSDHFGVAVSTTTPDPSEFTMIQEWTMTSKNGGMNGGRASRDGEGAKLGTWYNFSVDLSAYAGQSIYIAIRHFNCYDMYILCVDDISFGIDNRSVEYYNVKLDGVMEGTTELPFFQHNVEGFVEGETHNTQVQKVYTTGESEWASFDWVYTPCDNFAGLQADPTAEWQGTDVVLNWVLPGGDGPTPPPTPPTGDDNFSFDFEGGMNGWTTIDVDGDGLFWNHSTNSLTYSGYDYTGLGHNGSNGFAYSQSYIDYDGSYDPNNYLISPMKYVITSGSTLTFWADNANDSYPDHFGVAVATVDNPTPNDFTIVWEGGAKGAAGKAAVRHDNNRYNNWRQHTVNLGAYAGQAVWIAFRHFNSYDYYEIWIDDVTLTPGSKGNRDMTEGFESGIPSGWATIDADGDGYNWQRSSVMMAGYNITPHSGEDMVSSQSYDGSAGALHPDNYLVTSQVTLGGTFSFWACAQDASYAAEHFGVAVSTGSQTNAADFTTIAEWTMTAKGGVPTTGITRSSNRATGNYYQYTVDLSNYAGQTGYIAIRHFGCTDMFYLNVDDVEYTDGGTTPVDPTPTPGDNIIGVEIFRDGEWLAEVKSPVQTYTDLDVDGTPTYEFRVVYDGPTENYLYYAMSCPQGVTVEDNPCAVTPENLTGAYEWVNANEFGALINWTYGEVGLWLIYDDGGQSMGMVGEGADHLPMYWGNKYPAEMLAPYGNTALTEVAFIAYGGSDNQSGIYTLNVYVGGENGPQTLVHTQDYNFDGVWTGDWTYLTLTQPVAVDPSQSLWITFYNEGTIDYPAVFCQGGGDVNARWICEDGENWFDIGPYIPSVAAWMIRGYITNAVEGERVALEPFNGGGNTDYNFSVSETTIEANLDFNFHRGNRVPVSFNVYRNGNVIGNVAYESDGAYSYFDNVAAGNYEYQVTAVYEGCESDFALTPDESQNFVAVNVTGVSESIDSRIYPNPTTGNVTIEANSMKHITVFSALGQILYDANISGDTYTMNLGQYQAGLYMVRIYTEYGVSVKRVTVVK